VEYDFSGAGRPSVQVTILILKVRSNYSMRLPTYNYNITHTQFTYIIFITQPASVL